MAGPSIEATPLTALTPGKRRASWPLQDLGKANSSIADINQDEPA